MKNSTISRFVPALALAVVGSVLTGCASESSSAASSSASASSSAAAAATVTADASKLDQQGAADYAAVFFTHWFDPIADSDVYTTFSSALEDAIGEDAFNEVMATSEPVAAFESLSEEDQEKALAVTSEYDPLTAYLNTDGLSTAQKAGLDYYLISYTTSMGTSDSTYTVTGDGTGVTLDGDTAIVPFSALAFAIDGEALALSDDDTAYGFTLVNTDGEWRVSGQALLDFFAELSAALETTEATDPATDSTN